MNKLWYKNAVIYSLDVEAFKDSNNDGIGDFKGLKHRLHYLSSLGINCIWLLPFYDSPNKDNGYDVRDYYQIDQRLGDFGNFVEFLDAAEEEGMRILVDLVVNHTSDQHFWFKEARKDKNSPYRDYYIWSKTKPKDDGKHAILGEEQGNIVVSPRGRGTSTWYVSEAHQDFFEVFDDVHRLLGSCCAQQVQGGDHAARPASDRVMPSTARPRAYRAHWRIDEQGWKRRAPACRGSLPVLGAAARLLEGATAGARDRDPGAPHPLVRPPARRLARSAVGPRQRRRLGLRGGRTRGAGPATDWCRPAVGGGGGPVWTGAAPGIAGRRRPPGR